MTTASFGDALIPSPKPLLRVVKEPSGSDTLKSVGTALDVLECFASDEELGVSDIARRLGIAKSTAHRLLTTLCSRGVAEKNHDSGLYRLGLRLYELGQMAQGRNPLRRVALPHLEDVRRGTGLTAQLAVVDGADVIVIEQLDPFNGRGLWPGSQRRWPAHTTSCGQAVAAYNPWLAQVRREHGFPPRAPGTIRSAAEYDEALAEVRRRGVAIVKDSALEGYSSVAAPIRDLNGQAHAAVAVVGANEDLLPAVERTSRLLTTVAARISRAYIAAGAMPFAPNEGTYQRPV